MAVDVDPFRKLSYINIIRDYYQKSQNFKVMGEGEASL